MSKTSKDYLRDINKLLDNIETLSDNGCEVGYEARTLRNQIERYGNQRVEEYRQSLGEPSNG